MDREFWISELGRLYERSTEAIDEGQSNAVEPLAGEFNETLSQLKNEFPDNPIVSNTESVEPYTEGVYGDGVMMPSTRRDEALHEVRSRCEKMANAIGYELPELESGSRSPNRMVMVSVESHQETKQEVHQEVTIESIQQMIKTLPREPKAKGELQELLEEFETEIGGEQDQSKLRSILSRANEISTDVTAQMAVFALKRGVTAILGL